ncbi:acyl-CoA thioesterase [Nocardioides aequoreus]|uniref:acyl-CoA thioesterase n=1 Tax=Nocardioides aequoreus TaxID=397278 RepID=UPI0004C45025|nr:acyl-CoA thioesterase II [Nocardioides aequoreus]
MPQSAQEVVDLLDLETIEDNLFRGQQPDTELQRVFGGQVAAQALTAATRTVPEQYVVHSLHSYFLRPGDTAVPIVYDVDTLREGRSFATRRVLARQHGRPIFALTVDYQIPEPGLEHQDAMPDVPAPEECPTLLEATPGSQRIAEHWNREWSALDIRLAGLTRPGDAAPGEVLTRSRLWIRVNGEVPDDPRLQVAAFTYASDLTLLAASLVPHDLYIASPGMQAASLDHTIWFHRPFRADRWWLYDQTSPSASGGRGLALAKVFTREGVLVATVAQEGLIRHRPG